MKAGRAANMVRRKGTKRLGRYVARAVTLVSLCLCFVTAVFWIRSYSLGPPGEPSDSTRHSFGDVAYELASHQGNLSLIRINGFIVSANPPYSEHPLNLTFKSATGWHEIRIGEASLSSLVDHIEEDVPSSGQSGVIGTIQRGEIKYGYAVLPPSKDYRWPTYQRFVLRHWFVLTLLALAPAFRSIRWIARSQRSKRRRLRGLCVRCGYDLRESAERCPECGWTTGSSGPSVQ